MSEEIKHDRRSFRRAGAMSIATASLGIYGYCDAAGDGCSGSITLLKFISRYSTTKKEPTNVGNFTQLKVSPNNWSHETRCA